MKCQVEGAEFRAEGGHFVIRGRLDFDTVPEIWACALPLLEEDGGPAQLDLSALVHMDSAGLAFLAGLARRAKAGGGTLHIDGLSGPAAVLVGVAGLEPLFDRQPVDPKQTAGN